MGFEGRPSGASPAPIGVSPQLMLTSSLSHIIPFASHEEAALGAPGDDDVITLRSSGSYRDKYYKALLILLLTNTASFRFIERCVAMLLE